MSKSPAQQNGPPGNAQPPMASRDPRRIAAQSSTGYQDIAHSFQELVSQISATMHAEAEYKRIVKKRRLDKKDRAKAEQRQFQFPAALAQYRATSGTSENDQRLAQSELGSNQNKQKQLAQNLASTLFQVTESTLLNRINTDMDATKAQASRAETVSNDLKEEFGELKAVGPTVARLETDNKEMQSKFGTFNDSLSSAKSSVEHLEASMPPPCKHEETIRKLEETIKLNQEASERQIEELRREIASQKEANDTTARTCSGLEQKITSLSTERTSATAESVSTLHADFQTLSDRFTGLLDEQERRDNILTEELGNNQSSIQKLEKRIEELSESVAGIRKDNPDLQHQAAANDTQTAVEISKPQMPGTELQHQQPQNVDGLLQSIRNEQSRQNSALNALNVAVHSLQTRFNNMTSEPIVRQMANAMRTMYPQADKAQQSIEHFQDVLNGFVERMNLLNNRLDAVEQTETHAKAERDTFIKDMNAEKDKLVQELGSHGTRISGIEEASSDTKEQHRLALERIGSAEVQMKTVKADLGNVEDYASTKLATVLDELRKVEELQANFKDLQSRFSPMESKVDDVLETIRRHSAKAMEEMEERGRGGQEREEQEDEERGNGYNPYDYSSPETSEFSWGPGSKAHEKTVSPKVPTGPKSLPPRPPVNATVWGSHSPADQGPRPFKKRKKKNQSKFAS